MTPYCIVLPLFLQVCLVLLPVILDYFTQYLCAVMYYFFCSAFFGQNETPNRA